MSREKMIEYIQEQLECATDKEVEMVYGLLFGLLGHTKERIALDGLSDDEVEMLRCILCILRGGDKRKLRLVYFFARNL